MLRFDRDGSAPGGRAHWPVTVMLLDALGSDVAGRVELRHHFPTFRPSPTAALIKSGCWQSGSRTVTGGEDRQKRSRLSATKHSAPTHPPW